MKKLFMLLLVLLITTVATYAQMLEQWASRYNGPRGYDDFVSAMAVDASGNVIVTGYAIDSIAGTTGFMRYATVKYNSSGVQQWSAIYHVTADTVDAAYCNGVDAEGNIYVTGSAGISHESWATIKYNSFGVQQWIQIYGGIGIGGNRPVAMVVDALGNVYITGSGAVVSGQDLDYVTIKYNTYGVQQWVSTYNYRPNYPGSDEARAITIDNIGNVYVAGTSYDSTTGGHYDMTTIKYNSSGSQQWVQRRLGGGSINVVSAILTDNFGNVFVSGTYIIKYNSSGFQQWEKSSDYSFSIALDLSGNLYASEVSSIKKYNTSGDTLWSKSFTNYSISKLTFENCLGNVYVCATTFDTINYYDYLTIGYNSYGDSLWAGTYGYQAASSEQSRAITSDGLGNVYVTGESTEPSHFYTRDYATVKYTPSSFFVHTAKRDNLNKPITDNQSTSDSIFIDCSLMNYSTGDMRVNIDDLRHTKDSDLEIYLIHPGTTDNINSATIIDTLVYQVGGTGQNFIGTKLDDSAAISINDGSAPFTGLFRPHRPLSQLNGLSMEGNWILKIYDRASGNEGVLNAWSIDFGLSSQSVGIQEISGEVPGEFNLSQNYPNPFNPITSIKYIIDSKQFVNLKVYDLLGREVATLVNEEKPSGNYEVNFDASRLSSGVYFYKLVSGNFVETKKMILMR